MTAVDFTIFTVRINFGITKCQITFESNAQLSRLMPGIPIWMGSTSINDILNYLIFICKVAPS